MKPLLIIHGWSDEAESFLPLARALEANSGRRVSSLFLGNYISLDDDVQMADLVRGLQRAWEAEALPLAPKSIDVIVHSTGGLIIRDWMASCFSEQGRTPPINNLLMLAPANFGSPLAHKGRAIYGRVLKGFNARKRFQTGARILRALEMASPYAWALAQRDRLQRNPMSASGVRTTVIVGNTGYRGISSLANELGSDGTVYAASANLDCAALEIRFPPGNRVPQYGALRSARGDTAFVLMDGFDHSSIALKSEEHPDNPALLDFILQALDIRSTAAFRAWRQRCAEHTATVLARHGQDSHAHKHGFQNTVFRVRDDQGFDVQDYVIEFFSDTARGDEDRLAEQVHGQALVKVHVNKDNAAYRSFMIDCSALYRIIDAQDTDLSISLSALPDLGEAHNLVGYRSFGNHDIGQLRLDARAVRQFFQPNRTVFIDIVLTREHKDELFTIQSLNALNP
ncbi:MAG: hypothetical protein KDI25_11905 [Pseudomonadales bacterium]|nr:hypothetical protein [Pseudomonadales bacterium]